MVFCPPRPTQSSSPPQTPGPRPAGPLLDPASSQDESRLLPGAGARAAAARPLATGRPARPRRKRRRIAVAAVLSAAVVLGVAGPSSPRPVSSPGGAIWSPANVIIQARARQQRRQRRILTGLAAAGAAAWRVTTGSSSPLGDRQPSRSGQDDGDGAALGQAGLPRYYVAAEQTQGMVVRATATGVITDTIPLPGPAKSEGATGVAVGRGAEFIAAFTDFLGNVTRLYSFRLTAAGRVTGLRPVTGGAIPGTTPVAPGDGLAVSPDGSKVALALACFTRGCHQVPQIVVIDLKTGARRTWTGGLQRRGFSFSVQNLSWVSSTTLAFLGYWACDTGRPGPPGTGLCRPQDAQVRTLSLTTGGGSLTQGHVLLRESARYPDILDALVAPGGAAVTIETGPPAYYTGLSFPPPPENFQVIRVPLSGGGQPRLLYQGALLVQASLDASLAFDSTGQHLLIVASTKNGNGWVDHGRLHLLPPQGTDVEAEAW